MTSRRSAWLCAVLLAVGVPAAAQTRDGGLELSAGLYLAGGTSFGQVESSQVVPGGGTRAVLHTTTSFGASPGLQVRLGAAITNRLAVEGGIALKPTELSVLAEDDIEKIPSFTAKEDVTQYLFDAGVRWRLGSAARRFSPFLTTGGGYMRQLHEQQTLVESGRTLYVGAGGHYKLRQSGSGWIKSSGIRIDLRAVILSGEVTTDDAAHPSTAATAAFFLRF